MTIKQLQNDTVDNDANPLPSLAHRIPVTARMCFEKIKRKLYETEIKYFHVYQSLYVTNFATIINPRLDIIMFCFIFLKIITTPLTTQLLMTAQFLITHFILKRTLTSCFVFKNVYIGLCKTALKGISQSLRKYIFRVLYH